MKVESSVIRILVRSQKFRGAKVASKVPFPLSVVFHFLVLIKQLLIIQGKETETRVCFSVDDENVSLGPIIKLLIAKRIPYTVTSVYLLISVQGPY